MTIHTLFIILYTASGLCAFLFGCLVFEPSLKNYKFNIFYYSLYVLTLTLIAAMAIDGKHLLLRGPIAYSLLILLAIYTFYRAILAKQRIINPGKIELSDYTAYIGDIGFTLISLFAGFAIVGAIGLGASGWLTGVIGLLAMVAGINTVTYKKGRLIDELKPAA